MKTHFKMVTSDSVFISTDPSNLNSISTILESNSRSTSHQIWVRAYNNGEFTDLRIPYYVQL